MLFQFLLSFMVKQHEIIVPRLCLSAGSTVPYMKTYTKKNCEMVVVNQRREVAKDT